MLRICQVTARVHGQKTRTTHVRACCSELEDRKGSLSKKKTKCVHVCREEYSRMHVRHASIDDSALLSISLRQSISVDHERVKREERWCSVNWTCPTIDTITPPNAHTFAVSETRHACRCSLVFARASFSYLLVQKSILSPEASAAPARV